MEIMFGTAPSNKPKTINASIDVIKKALDGSQGNVVIKKKKS